MKKARALTPDSRSELEAVLGYRFANRQLLDKALTHASALKQKTGNYERMEFLGDRVLGLCIAELLFAEFSSAREGELSVRFNQLVSARTCAEIADELQLDRYIQTGAEANNLTLNVRADVVEGLIAAIYLDGGMEPARRFILSRWEARSRQAGEVRRDAKTELQEWAHARHGVTPSYRLIDRTGPDHQPQFTVSVEVKGVQPMLGRERSKRLAEQVAATRLLEREGVWQAPDTVETDGNS